MGYGQWIKIKIYSSNMTVKVKNADIDWGKFYKCGDKDDEIEKSDINKIEINAGETKSICSCGRDGAASGTEGELELYEGDNKIGKFTWDCPWSGKNKVNWEAENDSKYFTKCEGGDEKDGSIGDVSIDCSRKSD